MSSMPTPMRAQAGQRLQRVEVLVAVAAVPAAGVAVDRADQPDLLVVAQRRLAQPAAPGHVLDGESCHDGSKTHLKRLKSSHSQRWALPSLSVPPGSGIAERRPGRVAHHPPRVRLLDSLCAELLQPGDFGGHVVGVDIEVNPGGSAAEALHEQPEVLAGQLRAVIFGKVEFAQGLAGGPGPERHLTIVVIGGHVDHDRRHPAVVRHELSLRSALSSQPGLEMEGGYGKGRLRHAAARGLRPRSGRCRPVPSEPGRRRSPGICRRRGHWPGSTWARAPAA